MRYYLAIDIGGTKTAVALYGSDYSEFYHSKILTNPQDGCRQLAERIYRMASHLLEEYPIEAAGIACPGPLDVAEGVVNNTTTLGWNREPIVQIFQERFRLPFLLINDCNAGCLGENSGLNCRNMVYLSVSTGIGGGIIVDGKLYEGRGNAAEFGHIRTQGRGLKCGCGRRDCLELYASGTAIEREYYRLTEKLLTGPEIADLAMIGDETAVRVYGEAAEHLAQAILDICKTLDPELLIIGGGVSDVEAFRSSPVFRKLMQDFGLKIRFSDFKGKQVLLGVVVSLLRHERESNRIEEVCDDKRQVDAPDGLCASL